MDNENKKTVYNVAGKIIWKFENSLGTSSTKANLARLRNSIGNDISQTVYIWQEVFEEMPKDFLSKNGKLTKEENAIFTTLQLYALHQQGNSNSVNISYSFENSDEENKKIECMNMGDSLNKLRLTLIMEKADSKSLDRRFNAMITSANFNELTIHLRHLISILKANKNIKINYSKLADDLFDLQKGSREEICLKWGQSYYSNKNLENKGEKNER